VESEIKRNKQAYWRAHIESWNNSGLSKKAYCSQVGINYGSFINQQSRILSRTEQSPLKFIERKIPEQTPISSIPRIHLMLPSGIRIGIEGDLSAELIETVLQVASKLSC
jgi:hypothetical protein